MGQRVNGLFRPNERARGDDDPEVSTYCYSNISINRRSRNIYKPIHR